MILAARSAALATGSAILAASGCGFLVKVRNGGSGILRPHADGKQQGDEKSLEFHLVLENSLSLVRDEFTATGADDGVNANRGLNAQVFFEAEDGILGRGKWCIMHHARARWRQERLVGDPQYDWLLDS